MLSTRLGALAALAGSLCLAQPAAASILYDFSFTKLSDGQADFALHYVAPDYITVTGLGPVAAQSTSLGYDVLNFGTNKLGIFLFSNTGGFITDSGVGYSDTTFSFDPSILAAAYLTAPGVYAGTVSGNVGPILHTFGGSAQLTITDTATSGGGGVPEPATWALMLTGFGLVGATLRRRPTVQPA